jgi:hypothetical protein
MKNFSDFQKMRYTKYMAILDNVDNDQYPLFETESSSEVIQNISDCCSNGCSCQTSSDHNTEFVQDIIDFEQ